MGIADYASTVFSNLTYNMMEEIDQFAASTPYEQMELAAVAKQLLAFGEAQEDIIGVMRQLGDVASLSGSQLGDLARIYGKVKGTGRLMTESLDQFLDRGIPIGAELARMFGADVTEAEIRKMASSGEIGFQHMQTALSNLTAEGGLFFEGMKAQSETLGGRWSTLTGNLKTSFAALGAQIAESFNIKGILEWSATMAGEIAFVLKNWDIYSSLMGEYIYLGISNAWNVTETFFRNVGKVLYWLYETWRDIFMGIADYASTVFSNLTYNMMEAWNTLWAWIRGRDYTADFKGISEGYRSALADLQGPELETASVATTNDVIRNLWRQLDRARGKGDEAETVTAERTAAGSATPQSQKAAAAAAAAGGGGDRGGFVGLAELARQMQQAALDQMRKRREEELAKRTATATEKLAKGLDNGGLKVQIVNQEALAPTW